MVIAFDKSCRRATWLGVFIAALTASFSLVAAEEPAVKPPAAKKKVSTLDEELLRDLGGDPAKDPFERIDKKPPPEKSPAKPAVSPLDEELLRNLEGGEDRAAGDADGQDPIQRLNHRMRQVEQLLRARKSDTPTQELQGKIVRDLEELIKQLRQQQQQSSSSSGGQQKQQQTGKRESIAQPQQQQQQQQQAGTGSKSSPKPARDSSQQVGKANAQKPDPGKIQDLIKDIWGELPARLRQQMLQSSVERFVPKYELQIEEYFKTLSEQREGSGDKR